MRHRSQALPFHKFLQGQITQVKTFAFKCCRLSFSLKRKSKYSAD
jgi:hypothetical protein